MKRLLASVLGGGVLMAVVGCAANGNAMGDEHIFLPAEEVEWRAGPASLEEGAEFAVLEGDPSEPGPVTMRLRLPDGFVIAPHWHPRPERLTVLEGTFNFAMQSQFDPAATEPLRPGSFFVMPPGMHHFAIAEGETIVQLNVQGPWEIIYLDPEDDPRNR